MTKPRTKPRTVEVVRSTYQPSKRELESDARVPASFEQAVTALTKPVKIRYIDRPKRAS